MVYKPTNITGGPHPVHVFYLLKGATSFAATTWISPKKNWGFFHSLCPPCPTETKNSSKNDSLLLKVQTLDILGPLPALSFLAIWKFVTPVPAVLSISCTFWHPNVHRKKMTVFLHKLDFPCPQFLSLTFWNPTSKVSIISFCSSIHSRWVLGPAQVYEIKQFLISSDVVGLITCDT